ncbi:hypothetical protein HH1059_25170 [Halorhodospira halochloris]|uniref:Uncharacterized protein n=1 Tax=Halorhodospira halochloris TaxID=1052 RepID=A0A0X8X6N9_HALHR|nr:hypothetical protein [Halorhodospira halochloris]BAU56594.2 hypothetical protein HH1059_25170 [Halorhodospira halochloris]
MRITDLMMRKRCLGIAVLFMGLAWSGCIAAERSLLLVPSELFSFEYNEDNQLGDVEDDLLHFGSSFYDIKSDAVAEHNSSVDSSDEIISVHEIVPPHPANKDEISTFYKRKGDEGGEYLQELCERVGVSSLAYSPMSFGDVSEHAESDFIDVLEMQANVFSCEEGEHLSKKVRLGVAGSESEEELLREWIVLKLKKVLLGYEDSDSEEKSEEQAEL